MLLPVSLASAWADRPVPSRLAVRSGLSQASRVGELHGVAIESDALSELRAHFAHWLSSDPGVRTVKVTSDEIWASMQLERLPCSTRTRHAIMLGLYRRQLLPHVAPTFGELLDARNVGPTTALDFVCAVESAASPVSPCDREPAPAQHAGDRTVLDLNAVVATLAAAGEETWSAYVTGADPRFSRLLNGMPETVRGLVQGDVSQIMNYEAKRRRLAEVLGDVRAIVRRIETGTLEDQVNDLLRAASGTNEERTRLLAVRLNCTGSTESMTLEQIGEQLKITRERARQLEVRLLRNLPPSAPYLPALDSALELIVRNAPIAAADVGDLLRSEGVATGLWEPEALICTARLMHRRPEFEVTRMGENRVVTLIEEGVDTSGILRSVSRRLMKVGITTVGELWTRLTPAQKAALQPDELQRQLTDFPGFTVFDGEWCWLSDVFPQNLRTPILKMLAVCPTLDVASLHDGLDRYLRFHQSRIGHFEIPPLRVLDEYLNGVDELVVDSVGNIRAVVPVSENDIFGDVELQIVRMIRESPHLIVDRETIFPKWAEAEENIGTLSTMLVYSPVVQRVGRGRWTIRGAYPLEERYPASPSPVNATRVRELVDNGPGGMVMSLSIPEPAAWETIELPGELALDWEETVWQVRLDGYSRSATLRVPTAGPSPDLAQILRSMEAVAGEVLQMRLNSTTRSGIAEVMSLTEYLAMIGRG